MSQGCHGDHGSECVLHASEQTILRVLMLTVIIAEKTNIFETIHFYKVVFFFFSLEQEKVLPMIMCLNVCNYLNNTK